MASAGYFTPMHTNMFGVIAGSLGQVLATVGCGGLAGLSYANFSVMPSIKQDLSQKSWLRAQLSSPLMFAFVPCAFIFTSLELIDGMVLYGAAPALLGMGMLGTSVYLKALDLELPLWYSRQIFRLIVLSICGFLMLGYMTVRREWSVRERGQLLHSI